MALLTQAQYAKARGVTRQAVSQAVREGRIPLVTGKIDPTVADVAFDQQVAALITMPSYAESKAAKAAFDARLRKMQCDTLAGKLISFEESQQLYSEMIVQARDILVTLGPQIADEVAAETDPKKIGALIDREVRRALARLREGLTKVATLRVAERFRGPRLVVNPVPSDGRRRVGMQKRNRSSARKKQEAGEPEKG